MNVLLRTALFTLLVPGTVAVYIPRAILRNRTAPPDALGWHWLGLASIVAGAAIYFWCAWDFATTGRGTPAPIDAPKTLVVRGLYRYTRNPMYVGVLSVLGGEALLFRSLNLLTYMAVVFVFFFLFVIGYEEPALRGKFGESFERYRAAVPRWIPRVNSTMRAGSLR